MTFLDDMLEGTELQCRGDGEAGAIFGPGDDPRHRYYLWRSWGHEGAQVEIPEPTPEQRASRTLGPITLTLPVRRWVTWLMLNPSTADESVLDPTLRRCREFSRRWGYTGFDVLNAYAFRSTDPVTMLRAPDRVGRYNDALIAGVLANADLVVCAWGRRCEPERDRQISALLAACTARTACLGRTLVGNSPRHPLYLAGDTELEDWPSEPPSTTATFGRLRFRKD